MHHNAVVRVDVRVKFSVCFPTLCLLLWQLWKWNFSDSGLTNTYKSALGCESKLPAIYTVGSILTSTDYMCLSIVDVTALKTSEFVYLISEYAGQSFASVVANLVHSL